MMVRTGTARPGRALVCAPLPPEFDREGGSRRIHHFLDFLLEEGWAVSFICENAPADSRHLRLLRQRGVAAYVGFGGQAADVVAAGRFDVAIFAFWHIADRYAGLVRRLSPQTPIVVETVDLHWLRNARRVLAARDDEGKGGGRLDSSFGTDIVGELNVYARADAVLTVSEKEAAFINDIVGRSSLARSVPDCDIIPPSRVPFEGRRGILFVGNFRHPPNVDAVAFLCEEILPLLPPALRSEHALQVVGNAPDGRVQELVAKLPEARLVGWVPSVVPYLQAARVSVVPIRYGAGTKRKLLQALLARTPTVTTTMGAEGLDVVDGLHVLLADDAPSFAGAVERLLLDLKLWSDLAGRGRRRLLPLHGRKAVKAKFLEALDAVLSRPARAAEGEEGEAPGLPKQELREREAAGVRRAAQAVLPRGASLLVVSKGDSELLQIPGCRARHFPESVDGEYAGYHPRDSAAAIRHLDEVGRDAEYLLLPASAFWWLDYYAAFGRHLGDRHERVWSDDNCVIYRLRGETGGRDNAGGPRRSGVPPDARVEVGGRLARRPPEAGDGPAAPPGGKGAPGAGGPPARGGGESR